MILRDGSFVVPIRRVFDNLRVAAVAAGLVLIAVVAVSEWRAAGAANPPPEFVDSVVVDEIYAPVQIEMLPDGRVVVLTDSGRAHVIKNDQLLGTPFFDLRSSVDDVADRGLFSMALDNNFAQNGFIYVHYTFDTNGTDDGVGRSRLSRLTVSGDTAANEVVLFESFPEADVALHYGGSVEMGSDGKLYVTVGDYLIGANGQDRSNIKGTVLRLNTDGSIPSDNPFYNELTGTSRAIYAYGLRNPWQTEEHPVTGEIFISDVGSSDYEELNVLAAGANYGWFLAEGPKDPNNPAHDSFTDPLWSYPHFGIEPGASFEGCSIIGGAFYETPTPTFPVAYRGKYFTGDYCAGTILSIDTATGQATPFMDGFVELVDMAVSPTNGDLYYVDRSLNGDNQFPKGGVGKVSYVGEVNEISITTPPTDVSIAVGGTASFFVGVSAPGDVTYQWLRDGVPIPGEVSPRLTIANVSQADDQARFKVEVSNGAQTIRSDSAVLHITNNTVPVPTITVVDGAAGYRAGSPISFTGSATDAEDGAIPAGDLRWELRLNHDDHDHALTNGIIGSSGSYAVPPAIETSTNVWVTIYLTATDSEGTSSTTSARVDPRIVTMTLDTDPAGLDVQLEGGQFGAPFSFQSVSGVVREVGAPSQQTAGGVTYSFVSWSDGLGQNELRITPDADATITATYAGPGADVCVVSNGPAGGVRIVWTDKPGTEVLRNDDGWVATPPPGTLVYDSATGELDDGWLIRRRGVDEICVVDGDPPPPSACTVAARPAGGVDIDWDPVPGENRYQVRFAGGAWIATVVNATDYTFPGGDLASAYVIRYDLKDGNGAQNIPCDNDAPPPPDVCIVSPLGGGGVRIEWTNKPGTEVLRNDDGWVATPAAGTLTYDDPGGALGDGWLIRRSGVDEVCDIQP